MARTPDEPSTQPTAPPTPETQSLAGATPVVASPSATPGPGVLPRGATLGRYVLLDCVGTGSMGMVYAAYDPELDRKVALKLMRVGGEEARARLLLEARALARVSHPNVLSVFDVGSVEDQVFVTREFVAGTSLSRWLRLKPRSLQEVLPVLLLAGKGLAAAHAGGLVHRDFKPDNVLVGEDGRVHVADFGLAYFFDRPGSPLPEGSAPAPRSPAQDDSLAGTPAYMSPEQYRRLPPDARSDQFSFCVTLYEALYGARPFTGENLDDLGEAICTGRLREPPSTAHVPLWLERVVRRGLSTDPARRYPSMVALLEELEATPRRSLRRRAALAAAVGTALTVGALFFLWPRPPALCQGASAQLTGVWDDARRQAVEDAFLATGVPYASGAWEGVRQALDAYSEGWVSQHTDACEATQVRRVQSAELMDLRMLCLQGALADFSALTGLLSHADASLVQRAAGAVDRLPSLRTCADLRALTARVRPPPEGPQREAVEALRTRLAEARALRSAGRNQEALDTLRPAFEEARAMGYPPLHAELLVFRAELENVLGHSAESEASLYAALREAQAGRDMASQVQAWVRLGALIGTHGQKRVEGERFFGFAEATLAGASNPEELRALVLSWRGDFLVSVQAYEAAERDLREALALQEKLHGPQSSHLALELLRLGAVLSARYRHAEAQAVLERAVRLYEQSQGAQHPFLTDMLAELGQSLLRQGRLEEARAVLERGLALAEAAYGPGHLTAVYTLLQLGEVETESRRFPQALDYRQRCLETLEKSLGSTYYSAQAEAAFGRTYAAMGDARSATPPYQRAVDLYEKHAKENPEVLEPLAGLAQAWLHQGERARALPLLERALEVEKAARGDPVAIADARFLLARVLWEAHHRRPEAVALASRVRDTLATVPASGTHTRVQAWLTAHSL